MATLAAIQAALVAHVGTYAVIAGQPAWKRYLHPELFIGRFVRSLEHGAYAVGFSAVEEAGERQRNIVRARATWTLRVSYQLSPTASAGQTDEETTLFGWADAIRGHVLAEHAAQGTLGTAGVSLLYGSERFDAPADGWIWYVLSGRTSPFYLEL